MGEIVGGVLVGVINPKRDALDMSRDSSIPNRSFAWTSMLGIMAIVLPCVMCDTIIAGEHSDSIEEHRPYLSGYERFYREDSSSSIDAGRFLFGELNCVACHATDEFSSGSSDLDSVVGFADFEKRSPILNDIGQRVRPDYLREFLLSPHEVKPGTTMPDALANMPDREKEQVVEGLVALLSSTGRIADVVPRLVDVERGEAMFHSIGCIACHAPIGTESEGSIDAVPLVGVGDKYSVPSLSQFLSDPISVRPSARMPDFNLTDDEARQVASYLLRDIDVDANLTFRYYEGSWQSLPDFSSLEPVLSGPATSFDVTLGPRLDQFAMVFTGYLPIDRPGEYRFVLGSDDGSRVRIDGESVGLHDGIHAFSEFEFAHRLERGVFRVDVEYFEQGGEERLKVEVEGPGLTRQPLEGLLFATEDLAAERPEAYTVDEALIENGAQYFISLGCANCHQLQSNGVDLVADLVAKPVPEMRSDRGALSAVDASPCLDFGLDDNQTHSLRMFVENEAASADTDRHDSSRERDGVEAQRALIHRSMVTFNCYACHQRDETGGVTGERDPWFTGLEPEMGDEGRLPPPVTGVGAKLNETWLKQILFEGANDRPYVLTRMPGFGEANVGHMVDSFRAVDTLDDTPPFEITDSPRRVKVAGRMLVGRKGLSCIQCHTWGETRSSGVQAMSLTTMTRRLNKDWFQLYMLDAGEFRPGTRMPNSWPRGKTYFPNLLGGDTHAQIHAVWTYLEDGLEAPMPEGLVTPGILLEPETEPIVYRNFVEGAGTRAIAIGYPEDVNLAFDANELRLALLWQGAFIDARRHWTGRGQGWQPPAGENILSLSEGPLLARVSGSEAVWPEFDSVSERWRFRGYRFDDNLRPVFRYAFDNVEIEDHPVPQPDDAFPFLVRTIVLHGEPGQVLWVRPAVADHIDTADGIVFQVDDWELEVSLPSGRLARAFDTQANDADQHELRGLIELNDAGTASLQLIYRW